MPSLSNAQMWVHTIARTVDIVAPSNLGNVGNWPMKFFSNSVLVRTSDQISACTCRSVWPNSLIYDNCSDFWSRRPSIKRDEAVKNLICKEHFCQVLRIGSSSYTRVTCHQMTFHGMMFYQMTLYSIIFHQMKLHPIALRQMMAFQQMASCSMILD